MKITKKSIILISLFLLLLVAIPSSFAIDMESADDSTYYSNSLIIDEESSELTDELSISNDLDGQSDLSDSESNQDISNEDDSNKMELTNDNILQGSNEYYFDASVEKDTGNGSAESPYKYLTSNRIKANSVIHLANGEYRLDKRVYANNVNIIGTDADKTIISYNGLAFSISSSLYLTNVTLTGINILNNGELSATNTIFRNGKGYTADTYGNNFGGAIYSPYNEYATCYVDLINCTFINNTAEYGGAIYMDYGVLTIDNSYFINNTAFNYGGAIALEYNQRATITGTEFIGDVSTNDAGGGIYLKNSPISGENLKFTDCTATFGSGITSLYSTVNLKSITGKNNIAKYYGGVLYHMYGAYSLSDSSFTNNSARNGGAVFIDNSTSLYLTSTTFINNKASISGGAVYSLLNNLKRGNSVKDTLTENIFIDNEAPLFNDAYESDKIDLNIGNGNYTMYHYNESEIGDLPSYYSLIDLNQVTTVKDQQTSGNCWAFTAIATLESCILKASGDNLNLSEEHMKNIIEFYSDYGWAMDTNGGGYDEMPIGYYVSWLGPVYEDEDLTDDMSTLSPLLNSIMHVQNVLLLGRNNYTDNNAIKEALMKYGAVATGIYYDYNYLRGYSYNYYGSYTYGNHAVTIVGWDDNYSKDNFYGSPAGNGAWIVKNSWNTDWGNDGFFYVSYYDKVFAKVGDPAASYTFILNDTIKYDKNYQYDIAGKTDYFYNSSSSVWYKNVFTSTDNEILSGVSTYFEKLTDWTVSIVVNNESKLNQSGTSRLLHNQFRSIYPT